MKQGPVQPAKTSSPTHLLVTCLFNAGRLEEAERVIQAQIAGGEAHGFHLPLGLIQARQGQVREAVVELRQALAQNPQDQTAREALINLLEQQARQQLQEKQWDAAGDTLAEALEVDPNNDRLRRLMKSVEHVLPMSFLKAGRRAQAADVWERRLQQNPFNSRTAHTLALLYYWWALDLEKRGEAQPAQEAWRKAIAHWTLLLHSDQFWKEWVAERAGVYGEAVSPEAVEGLRQHWRRRLAETFEKQVAHYADNGKSTEAERYEEYRMILWLEMETAANLHAVQQFLQQRKHRFEPLPPAGVLLLEQLGLKQQAQSLVEAALRLDRNQPAADQLRLCLSPWGSVLAAIALKRFKPARAKLKPELSGRGNASPDAHRLMARVCLEEGKDLAGRGQVPQALEVWQEGLQYARSEAEKNDIRAQVEEACVRRGEQLISQGQYEEAIRFLERAHGIFAGPNLKRTLSNAYTERGREKFSRDDLAGAQRDLEKALNLNEDNLRAKDLLATVYNNRSVEAFNRGELDTACDLIEKSLRMDPNNRTARQNAAQDFYARANRRFADLPQYARYGYRLDPIRADLERALEYADDQELRYAIARDLGIVRMH